MKKNQSSSKIQQKIKVWFLYLFLIIGAFTMLFPFFWMISTSLKNQYEAIKIPPIIWPKQLQFSNWAEAWNAAPFIRYFINSVSVAFITTTAQIITAILAAFAFSKMIFYGKNFIFLILLGTMMVPFEMVLVPNFVTLSNLGMIDTYWALIVPWMANFFAVYTMRQAFAGIPDQLYYAAKVDGASDWQYLWKVLVPNSRSSITAIALIQVIASWNSFMWPLIVTNSTNLRTLPVGLQAFKSDAGVQYPELMAASTFVILPVAILYFVFNKYIVDGFTDTGIKG
ncbi:MAG: carbohydrate ABC transporter permease [Lactobacillaceae bacterium]|jgi:multiple sugar transport system permease protein|nr:carbohydrate ABC transporter permease [Lactobacillaceae bacterium]